MNLFKLSSKDTVYLSFLAVIFFALYFICVFGNVNSVEFMGIDEHSIIDSINGITSHSYYNMNANYHSQYYGWTYFSLNFFIVGIAKVVGVSEASTINLLVRSTHFIIGLLCTLSMYVLTRKLFSSLVAFIVTIAFISDPMLSHYLNEIHPESLGLFLQIVAILLFIYVYQSRTINTKKFIYAVVFLSLSGLCKQAFIVSNFFIGLSFLSLYYWNEYVDAKKIPYKEIIATIKKAIVTFFVVFFFIHPFAFLQPRKFFSAQAYISAEHSSKAFSEVFPLWMNVLHENPIVVLNAVLIIFVPFILKRHRLFSMSIVFSNLVSAIYIYKARLWIADTYLLPVFLFSFLNVAYFIFNFVINKLNSAFNTVKVVVVLFLGLVIVNNTMFSVYKQQSRYFKQGLQTKNLSWDYLEKLQPGVNIAYSPNIAMPEQLKKNACHAWQGCNDFKGLTKYDPELIVISPDYPHYNNSEYEKFIHENNYHVITSFSKEPVERTSCSVPYFNRHNFYIFSVSERYNSTRNCVIAYLEMLDDHANHRVVDGLPILVYAKSK